MTESGIVCVLGMHRSGTSLAAGLLNLLGVYFGSEADLIRPSPDNPKGFWEHRQFVALNDEILYTLGGNWHRPPRFPVGWQSAADLEEFRCRARAILQRDLQHAPLWGWKDPRTCLTLPFWQQLLPPMRCVTCVRHPFDVARSLERRNRFSLEKGLYLWLTYLRSAMDHIPGEAHCLVFYEDLIADSLSEMERLSEFLGNPERARPEAVQRAARELVDGDLQHHRTANAAELDGAVPRALAVALRLAEGAFVRLKRGKDAEQAEAAEMLRQALTAIAPGVEESESVRAQAAPEPWEEQVLRTTREIASWVPLGDTFILVDEDQWGTDHDVSGRRRLPFLERGGEYWGPPSDDATAIAELDRLRNAGANFMVFGWPAFSWLRDYPGLRRHLQARFPCLVETDRFVLFDLR